MKVGAGGWYTEKPTFSTILRKKLLGNVSPMLNGNDNVYGNNITRWYTKKPTYILHYLEKFCPEMFCNDNVYGNNITRWYIGRPTFSTIWKMLNPI